MLSEKVLAKYYNELVKLVNSKIHMGDGIYWREFRRWGYNSLKKVERKDWLLPLNLDFELTIQLKKISTIKKMTK